LHEPGELRRENPGADEDVRATAGLETGATFMQLRNHSVTVLYAADDFIQIRSGQGISQELFVRILRGFFQ